MNFETADSFESLRQEALELARFYSGKQWNTRYEHDPGLTMLEIFMNALALEHTACDALMRRNLFSPETGTPRWKEVAPGKAVFHYAPDTRIPVRADFAAPPVSREELLAAVESLSGVHKAFIIRESGGWVLPVLFAPVAVAPWPISLAPFAASLPTTEARRKRLLESVDAICRAARPLCERRVHAREMRCRYLALTVFLDVEDAACPVSAAAACMNAVRDILLGREEPLKGFTPALLTGLLQSVLKEEHAALGVSGVTLQPVDEGEETEGAAVTEQHPAGESVAADFSLPPGFDVFYPVRWRIHVRKEGRRRELPPDVIAEASRMADRLLLERLLAGPWAKSEEQAPAQPDMVPQESATPYLHAQFPSLYGLGPESLDPEFAHSASVRQTQGWLLFFEQLMGEALQPLRHAGNFFAPRVVTEEDFCPENATPLWKALRSPVSGAGTPESARITPGELAVLNRERLRFLAALQGEPLLFENSPFIPADCGPERLLELEAVRLDLLPLLNGVRLARRAPGHELSRMHGFLNPLALRLSLLLLPFSQCAFPPSELFEIRAEHNSACGHDEYRCCVYAGPVKHGNTKPGDARLVVNQVARSLEEAECLGLAALRLASLPGLYAMRGQTARIGRLVEVSEPWAGQRLAARDGSLECLAEETAAWAGTFLPPWVEVLEYTALGEERPFEMAVLVEAGNVPPEYRAELARAMRREIPAHLRALVFFLDARRMGAALNVVLHDPSDATHAAEDRRYHDLLHMLRTMEANGEAL